MKNYIVSIFFSILFFGCEKGDCFKNSGTVVKVQRRVASFHQIDLFDNINLVLTQDTTEALYVEAGQNLQPDISTMIENGVLTIRNNSTCSWLRSPDKLTVYASVKKIDSVNYNSSGNVSSTNTLQADTITFYSKHGAGNVEITLHAKYTRTNIKDENADFIFHGKSDQCNSYTNARGSTDFSDFEVKIMDIGYVGVRDATINVTQYLSALIFHTGNVYYKGSPPVIRTKYYSSGKLYPKQ